MSKQLGGNAALSVIVSSETVGGTTGSDLYRNFWQGDCAEVASGNASVRVEFVVAWNSPGHSFSFR